MEVLLDTVVFESAVVFVASTLFLALGNAPFRSKFGSDMIQGSPRWTWVYGSVFQTLVLPGIFLCAWGLGAEFSLSYFTHSSEVLASPATAWFENAFLYAFGGYLARDMMVPMSPLFMLHHIVCLFSSLMCWLCPPCARSFIFGVFFLELGSGSQALFLLQPQSMLFELLHFVVMSVSNIAAIFFALDPWHHRLAEVPGSIRIVMLCITLAVCWLRQRACLTNCERFLGQCRQQEKKDA